MRALTLPTYGPPSALTLTTAPVPSPTPSLPLLLKIHAFTLNPGDIHLMGGAFKMIQPFTFPYTVCHDFTGTLLTPSATHPHLLAGARVIGILPITRPSAAGAAAEYTIAAPERLALAPAGVSAAQAAAIPCAGLTALQALRRAAGPDGDGIRGKTVLITACLGGIGAFAAQMAKRVFGAGVVIGTASTSKVAQVPELLGGGTVDRVVDYTAPGGVLAAVAAGSVDVYIDTAPGGTAFTNMAVMRRGGTVVSCTSLCRSTEMTRLLGAGGVPVLLRWVLDTVFTVNSWRARRWGVRWEVQLTALEEGKGELEEIVGMVEGGTVKVVVGRTVGLAEVGEVRAVAEVVGRMKKGGGLVGKGVVLVDDA
ncbi:chaperonin 10-like protein [Geopyxis carbonaria]|nr:chaperonin 10-like protein [Geopyxis carbonaria]